MWSPVGLGQIYGDKTASQTRIGSFVLYSVSAVLLSFCKMSWHMLVLNGRKLEGFL